jgi:asparagine synthase (glutamine-hydrolysing)
MTNSSFVGWIKREQPTRLSAVPDAKSYGSFQVLSTGFIANRSALIRNLVQKGGLPPSCDSEIFAAVYRHWGDALQKYVLGEYSVAIFDNRGATLFLTHDALGVRPLFYGSFRGLFVFASHLDALLKQTGTIELDDTYIGDFLVLGRHPGSRTVYNNIYTLPAGRSLRWNGSTPIELHTWSFREIHPIDRMPEQERDERFRALLREAVTTSVHGRTWAELSGGLDSSSVLRIAADCGTKGLAAISIIYALSRTADETEWMQAAIEGLKVQWHQIDGDAAQPFSELPDRPIAHPIPTVLYWRLFREYEILVRTNDVHTILTGIGGDNVLFGPPAKPVYLADQLFRLNFVGVVRNLRLWQDAEPEMRSIRHSAFEIAGKPLARYILRRSLMNESRELGICPWINPHFAKRVGLKSRRVMTPAPVMRSVGDQYMHERIWMQSIDSAFSWNQLLTTCELRSPLLYRPFVEFMFALPWSDKVRPGEDRIIQRRALKGLLPDQVRLRRGKRSTDEAIFSGLLRSRQGYAYLTEKPRIVERGYVRRDAWEKAVGLARFGLVRGLSSFLAAASLEYWLRTLEMMKYRAD